VGPGLLQKLPPFFPIWCRLKSVCPAVAFSDLITICFYRVGFLSPRPTPNLGDQASEFMSPGDKVAQLYPQALDFPFTCLLQQAGVWWGYSSPPPHRAHLYDTIFKHANKLKMFNCIMLLYVKLIFYTTDLYKTEPC
jgi:hypothetical protein